MTQDKFKCPECCVTCPNKECEYNGDASDCGCDECFNGAISDTLIDEYAEKIIQTNGCYEHILELLEEFVEELINVGWEQHKEYIKECNEE